MIALQHVFGKPKGILLPRGKVVTWFILLSDSQLLISKGEDFLSDRAQISLALTRLEVHPLNDIGAFDRRYHLSSSTYPGTIDQ